MMATHAQCPGCYARITVPVHSAPPAPTSPTSPTIYGDMLHLSVVNFTHGPRDLFFCGACTHKFIIMLRSFSTSPPPPPPPPPTIYIARPTPGPTLGSAP